MIRKQIVSSNEIDRQNQRISLCALQEMASHLSQSEAVARMGIAHDITLLPVGKVLQGELVDLGHGIIGLEVQIDDFMEEFQQIHGPDNESLYYGRSLQDSRPFVEICSDLGGEFTVSLNPIDFTGADFEEIVRFVSESENGQIETLAKKAFAPEIEIVITIATKILQCLIVKKLLDKTAEKISDDIASCYDKIKQLATFVFSKIKDSKEITYILSAPNQPVELIVRCNNADVLATAITEIDSGYISEVYESFSCHLNGEIKKIQFLFNVETRKWELNYITTSTGEVIGTEKCYKRTVTLYRETLLSPTAGFSIGAPVAYTVEEVTEE